MKIFWTLCAIAAPFIIYFLTKNLLIKYFERVFRNTGFNPITPFHQVVGFVAYIPLFICLFEEELFENLIFMIGFPVIVATILFFSNVKAKNPLTMLVCTLFQLVMGGLFVVRLVIWILMIIYSVLESVFHGHGPTINYNPLLIISMDSEGSVHQRKDQLSFSPGAGEGSLNHLNKYTDDIDKSRNIADRNRIEKELEEVRNRKQEAMIYGYDYAPFAMQEEALQKELDNIDEQTK